MTEITRRGILLGLAVTPLAAAMKSGDATFPLARNVFERHACGSFVVNGHMGAANDYMLDAWIRSCDGRSEPNEIRMASNVYAYYATAIETQWTTTIDLSKSMPESVENFLQLRRTKYRGSEIVLDESMEPGSMIFVRDGRIVAVCRGFTA